MVSLNGMITVAEAARRLGRSLEQVRRYLREGKLKGQRIGGQWFIEEASLETRCQPPEGTPQRAREVGVVMEAGKSRPQRSSDVLQEYLEGLDGECANLVAQREYLQARLDLVERQKANLQELIPKEEHEAAKPHPQRSSDVRREYLEGLDGELANLVAQRKYLQARLDLIERQRASLQVVISREEHEAAKRRPQRSSDVLQEYLKGFDGERVSLVAQREYLQAGLGLTERRRAGPQEVISREEIETLIKRIDENREAIRRRLGHGFDISQLIEESREGH
jgi:excisionase family DNA binding protein